MSRCKDITKLISDSMERELSFWQRIDLRTHLILCGMCRRFQANISVLRKFANLELSNDGPSEKPTLSLEAKMRIRDAIRRQSN